MEEWKDIGESNYQVSTFGNVRNKNGFVLKPKACPKPRGYVCYDVTIADSRGGKQKHHKIHQLVALAFIPNPENKPTVDHIDRNPANNRVENLRWASYSEQNYNSRTRADNHLGEKCIKLIKDGRLSPYKVVGTLHKTKFFKTLEDAIKYRDGVGVVN